MFHTHISAMPPTINNSHRAFLEQFLEVGRCGGLAGQMGGVGGGGVQGIGCNKKDVLMA